MALTYEDAMRHLSPWSRYTLTVNGCEVAMFRDFGSANHAAFAALPGLSLPRVCLTLVFSGLGEEPALAAYAVTDDEQRPMPLDCYIGVPRAQVSGWDRTRSEYEAAR